MASRRVISGAKNMMAKREPHEQRKRKRKSIDTNTPVPYITLVVWWLCHEYLEGLSTSPHGVPVRYAFQQCLLLPSSGKYTIDIYGMPRLCFKVLQMLLFSSAPPL
jgi:hypothetical protein